MNSLFKKTSAALTTAAVTAFFATTAFAAVTAGYTLFGDAQYVSPGNASTRAVKLQSDQLEDESAVCGHPFGCGGIDWTATAGTTFADLTTLSSDFMPEADDTCIGGSPRFQINVEDPISGDTGNIFAYFGTDSGSPACLPGVWQNSTDLLELGKLVDTSQLDGGAFYDPYATALTKYGSYEVTGIQVVVDGSWATGDSEQTVLIDNTMINEVLYNYEPTNQESRELCKNGGWMTMTDGNGNPFKNQGDCVSHFSTSGRNPGNG
jgi:hypothetical protein